MTKIEAPFQRHSDTSREAAQAIAPTAETLRERVFSAIKESPVGMTAEEIQHRTGIKGDTVRPRIVELYRANRIHIIGTRRTQSNRRADVWFAKGETA